MPTDVAGRVLIPQVYSSLPAENLEAADFLAERDHDGNRSAVLRDAAGEYLSAPG
jgi:hypothetical protein